VYTGSANQLPQDRESVYYFNVLDVPPVDKSLANKHYVRFVFNTRIKLFYRPAHLLGTLGEAEKNLRWMLVKQKNGTALKAVNASPYYVSFSKIVLKQHDKIYNTQQQGGMVAPRSAQLFPLVNGQRVTQGGTVEYMAINDYGGNVPLNASLSAPLTGVAGT
jgi:chaperone protein EcpD